MNPTRILLIAVTLSLVALLLGGCGSTVQYDQIDPTRYEKISKDTEIQVHRGTVREPHVVLGTMTMSMKMEASTKSFSTYDDMIAQMKDKCRDVGGHALVEVKPVQSANGSINTNVVLVGTVVRYLEHESTISAQ